MASALTSLSAFFLAPSVVGRNDAIASELGGEVVRPFGRCHACAARATALKAARKPSRAVNVEAKTHVEAAAFLSHLADFYRHGVSWFSDACAAAA